jgi:SAM-dependent methyltransferase
MTKLIRSLYDGLTFGIQEKWFGTLQAGAVVRSLYLTWTLKKFIPSSEQYNILDAGSGEGAPLTIIQARRYQKCNFVAIDLYQKHPVGRNAVVPANVELIKEDLFRYSTRQQFDIIFCLDVLEHIENYKKVLKSFHEWIRPGGKLILHVPSICQVSYFIQNDCSSTSNEKQRLGDYHVRKGFRLNGLIIDITNTGFEIIYSRYTFSPITWFFKELFSIGEKKRLPGIGIMILPFIWFSTKLESLSNLKKGNGILSVVRKT